MEVTQNIQNHMQPNNIKLDEIKQISKKKSTIQIKSKPVEKWVVQDIIQNNHLHPTKDWNEQFQQDLHRSLLNSEQQDNKTIGQFLGLAILGLVGFAIGLTLVGLFAGSLIGLILGGYAGKRIKRKKSRNKNLIHFDLFMINCACYYAVLVDEITRNKGSIKLNNFRFKIQKTFKEYRGIVVFNKLSKSRQKGFRSEMVRLMKVLQNPEAFKAMYLIYKMTKLLLQQSAQNRTEQQKYDLQYIICGVMKPAIEVMRICYDELNFDQKYLLLKYEKFVFSYESLQLLEDDLHTDFILDQEVFLKQLEKEITISDIKEAFKEFDLDSMIQKNEEQKNQSPGKEKSKGKKLIDIISEQMQIAEKKNSMQVEDQDVEKQDQDKKSINNDDKSDSSYSDEIPHNKMQELEDNNQGQSKEFMLAKHVYSQQKQQESIYNTFKRMPTKQENCKSYDTEITITNQNYGGNSSHNINIEQVSLQKGSSTYSETMAINKSPQIGQKINFQQMIQKEVIKLEPLEECISNYSRYSQVNSPHNGYQEKSFVRSTRGSEFIKCNSLPNDYVPSIFKNQEKNRDDYNVDEEKKVDEVIQDVQVGDIENNLKTSQKIYKNNNDDNDNQSQRDRQTSSNAQNQDLEKSTHLNKSQAKDDRDIPDVIEVRADNQIQVMEDSEINQKIEKLMGVYNEDPGKSKWEKVVAKSEITIHKKMNLESAAVMVRAESNIQNSTPEEVFQQIYDQNYRAKWDKVLLGFKQLEKIDEQSDIIYSYVDAGFGVSKRDWVQKRYFQRDFPEQGQITIVYFSTEHKQYPPKKNFIRADSIISGYVIKPNGPNSVLFMLSCVDIKGLIPKYVVNFVAARAPKDWINALQKAINQHRKNQIN